MVWCQETRHLESSTKFPILIVNIKPNNLNFNSHNSTKTSTLF